MQSKEELFSILLVLLPFYASACSRLATATPGVIQTTEEVVQLTPGFHPDWLLEDINAHIDEQPCYLPIPDTDQVVLQTAIPELASLYQDEGYVCFSAISPRNLRIQISLPGCHSDCTLVYRRMGELTVNDEMRVIQLSSTFALQIPLVDRPRDIECVCTQGCEGAGMILLETGYLAEDVYAVKLGELELGTIQLPILSGGACFDSRATATPYRTITPTATRDLANYPAPEQAKMTTPNLEIEIYPAP